MNNHGGATNSNSNQIRGHMNISFTNPVGSQTQMQMPVNPQAQARPFFPGHFQLSEPQAQPFVQSQLIQPQTEAQIVTPPQGNNNTTITTPSPSMATQGSNTAGTAKRLQRPPSRPSGGSSGQSAASPMKTMELTPAVPRGKRKLPDKSIPEKIAAIYPESALYTELLELESRVDSTLARKKADIVESVKNPLRVQKVLRIYIFNTFESQTEVMSENGNDEQPSWSLRIIGRILEDGKDPLMEGLKSKSSSLYPKFSSFFKKITVYLDQNHYPDNHVIMWENSRSPALRDGFEVKRKGSKEFTAIVRLEMNSVPEKFKLSPALQEVMGFEVETRPRIMAALWQYVKIRKLQSPNDKTFFMCDPLLKRVFGEDKLKFSDVNQKLTPHLAPPGPIHLEHQVKLSGASPAGNTCYDVVVDVPLSMGEKSTFLEDLEQNKFIDTCDKSISSAMKKVHEHLRRRAFFLGFSQSPAEFINALIASQARDLKLAAADSGHQAEKEGRAEFYNQPWIEDAVVRYLNRKNEGSVGNK